MQSSRQLQFLLIETIQYISFHIRNFIILRFSWIFCSCFSSETFSCRTVCCIHVVLMMMYAKISCCRNLTYFQIKFCRQLFVCSDGFNNLSSYPQNFLQPDLLSGNLVPRFQHFLHLCKKCPPKKLISKTKLDLLVHSSTPFNWQTTLPNISYNTHFT